MTIGRLITPWWALRAGLGAAAFLAGLDKFFNLLAEWPAYLSPLVARVLPVSTTSFMHTIGVVEMGGDPTTVHNGTVGGSTGAHNRHRREAP